MTASSNAMPSMRGNRDGIARAAERAIVLALIATGATLIIVPLVLTLYLSLFDEKVILFPPRGYTLDWYPAIVPNFGRAVLTSLKLGALAVAGSLALGIPAGIGLRATGSADAASSPPCCSRRSRCRASHSASRSTSRWWQSTNSSVPRSPAR